MAYTTIDDPTAHFQTKTYTGSAGAQSITFDGNSNLQPDWIWIKERGAVGGHVATDTVRGISASSAPFLQPSATGAEEGDNGTVANRTLTSSNTNGFTLGQDAYYTNFNNNSDTYVSWNWKANGSGSANTAGSINTTSTSVNTTAGFSISTYTGNNTAGATIGHGLGVTPNLIIVKLRSASGGYWITYHHKVSSAPETDYLALNSSDAVADANVFWNDTAPTSTLITLGDDGWVNGNSTTHVCYAFAEKQGFSKFGSYIGNANADGPYIHLGFKPAFLVIKQASSARNWIMMDAKRSPFNIVTKYMKGNSTSAEETYNYVDFLSGGFKCRDSDTGANASGGLYVYYAFAENPFTTSSGVPATAR